MKAEDHFRAHCRGALRAFLGGHVKVTRLRISISHRVVHFIFQGSSAHSVAMRERYPLTGVEKEEVVNPTDPGDRVEVEVTKDWSGREILWPLDLKPGTP